MHSHITAVTPRFNLFSVRSLFFPPTLPFCKSLLGILATQCHPLPPLPPPEGRGGGEGGFSLYGAGTAPGGEEYRGGEKGREEAEYEPRKEDASSYEAKFRKKFVCPPPPPGFM